MKHLGDAPTHALQREETKRPRGDLHWRGEALPTALRLPVVAWHVVAQRDRRSHAHAPALHSEWRHSTGPQRTSIDACTPGPFRPL